MVTVQGRKHLRRIQRRCIVRNVACASGFVVTLVVAWLHLTALGGDDEIQQHNNMIPQKKMVSPSEHEEALDYVKSFDKLGKELAFFHIPKTAGTSIEHAAGTNNMSWGSCMFPHKPKRSICTYPPGSYWPQYVGWWHIPAFLFPVLGVDPYQNRELFGVIRDPYDRMLSEYYYICSLRVRDWRPDQCDRSKLHDPIYMNEWIRNKIQNRTNDYVEDNGHFTPQYDFVFGPNQERRIDYVLRMEDLDGPFHRLMKAFGLSNVHLEKRNAIGATERTGERSGALEQSTIQLINELYKDDFDLGGYEMQTMPS